jgi:hypothetical protein
LYDGFSIVWRGQSAGRAQDIGFPQWRSMPGVRDNPVNGRLSWAKLTQIAGRPLHDYLPADFALRLGSAGINAAANGDDLGAAIEFLPLLPQSRPIVPSIK